MEKEEIRQAIKAIPKDAWTRLPTHWSAATKDMTIRLQAAGGHLNNCEDLVALVQVRGQMAIFQWKRGDIL